MKPSTDSRRVLPSPVLHMLWTIFRRVGQVLLLPFFILGLIVGTLAVVAILIWRSGVVGYHTTRSLTNRGA